jgi:hypothetical protein
MAVQKAAGTLKSDGNHPDLLSRVTRIDIVFTTAFSSLSSLRMNFSRLDPDDYL